MSGNDPYGPGGKPRRLSEVLAGASVDRAVYVLGEVPAGGTFRAPAGPHAGHLLYLRKVVRRSERALTGSVMCVPCRSRWSFVENDRWGYDDGQSFY